MPIHSQELPSDDKLIKDIINFHSVITDLDHSDDYLVLLTDLKTEKIISNRGFSFDAKHISLCREMLTVLFSYVEKLILNLNTELYKKYSHLFLEKIRKDHTKEEYHYLLDVLKNYKPDISNSFTQ